MLLSGTDAGVVFKILPAYFVGVFLPVVDQRAGVDSAPLANFALKSK